MEEKLQNLLSQLTQEGVEKGNQQAAQIIAAAQEQAQNIIAAARKEADEATAAAQRKAQELDANTRSELRLFTSQAVAALKTEITNMLNQQLATQAVEQADKDGNLIKQLLLTITEQWLQQGQVTINAKDADSLAAYFKAQAKGLLDKGVKIQQVNGLKTDFEIQPAEGGYKVAFSEKELVEYLKGFLRPQLVQTLFA